MIGDTIFLTFTSDDALVTQLGNFKINSSNPATFTHVGNAYFVTHIVDATDARGTLTFQINVKNALGIYSPTVENTTIGSLVVIQ